MKVFVQFSDATKQSVVCVFGCAQDSEVYPNQDQIDDDDPRYVAFLALQAAITDGAGGAQ